MGFSLQGFFPPQSLRSLSGPAAILTLPFVAVRRPRRRARLHGVTPCEDSTSTVAALPVTRGPLPSWVFQWPSRDFPPGKLHNRSCGLLHKLSYDRRRTDDRSCLSRILPCQGRLASRETAAPHELPAPCPSTTWRSSSSRTTRSRILPEAPRRRNNRAWFRSLENHGPDQQDDAATLA